jgi:hypothetical protein
MKLSRIDFWLPKSSTYERLTAYYGVCAMQRRHQNLNVPSEIVRTIVAISETGSLSKAAELLGLGQSAVSGQIKRIQSLLGGELFKKTSNGTAPTPFWQTGTRSGAQDVGR